MQSYRICGGHADAANPTDAEEADSAAPSDPAEALMESTLEWAGSAKERRRLRSHTGEMETERSLSPAGRHMTVRMTAQRDDGTEIVATTLFEKQDES